MSGFGAVGANERIRILLELKGSNLFITQITAAGAANKKFGTTQAAVAAETSALNNKTFIQNQLLFSSRRLLFYTTLGFLGLGAAIVKMGFSYNNALQTTRVALAPVIKTPAVLERELGSLYKLAALSPFLFKDTVLAFRSMYGAFHTLGYSIQFTNDSIKAIIDGLSFAGKTSPAAINRIAVALQRMAFLERPMGQTINQLNRDGLNISGALHSQLNLTEKQIKNIANSGITAKQVIQAYIDFVNKTPGYANAAMRQANLTLSGSWAQFQDLISKSSGEGVNGVFSGLTKTLAGINTQLGPLFQANKPIGILEVVRAIDTQLTPKVHIVLYVFMLFKGVLWGVLATFYLLAKAINYFVATPLSLLFRGTGSNEWIMRQLGRALGIILALWLLAKLRVAALAFQLEILTVVTALNSKANMIGTAVWWAYIFVTTVVGSMLNLLTLRFILLTLQAKILTAAVWLMTKAKMIGTVVWWAYLFVTGLVSSMLEGLTLRFILLTLQARILTAAVWLMTAAMDGNPIFLILTAAALLIIGLTILYLKWKRFHDLVNKYGIYVAAAFMPMAIMIESIATLLVFWDRIVNAAQRFYDLLIKIKNVGSSGLGWAHEVSKVGTNIPTFHWAKGGTQPHAGTALVGENGPEILKLPGGSVIKPLRDFADGLGQTLNINVIPQDIYLDGVKVGTVIADVVTDKQARGAGR